MNNDPFEPGLLNRLPRPVRKLVVLRASRIGDFICATPAFRALRGALPEAEITLITLPMLADLARRSPDFDRVLPFPGYPGIAEQLFDPRQALRFLQQMQAEQFELSVQMQGSGVYSNPFCLLLGARYTAGFVRSGDPPGLLDAATPLPEEGHEVQRVLALARFLGAAEQGLHTAFPLWPQDHQAAASLLGEAPSPWIGLHPYARDLTRRWPLERFAQAGLKLRQERGGTLVLLGETQEKEAAGQLAGLLGPPCLDLTGRTSLPVLGAVISRLSVLITNDTGPAHVAYALGCPTVTIFGGGDPARYGPPAPGPFRILAYPVPCRPCAYAECPIEYLCLEKVSVAQVVAAAGEVIS